MKEIKAIIQPYMLQDVCDALLQIENLPGLTVSQVLGFGRTRATEVLEAERIAEHSFAKKTKIEIVVQDNVAQKVVDIIAVAARTGKAGDGKIFVCDIGDVVRIRTGERGPAAV